MDKNLKKSYENLNLAYSATIEEVIARKQALIKIFKSKSVENKISTAKKIALIESSANAICDNIEKNGMPKDDECRFETTGESILGLAIVLFFVVLMCIFSFYAFL